jgi:nucleoid-associated protein EbfC
VVVVVGGTVVVGGGGVVVGTALLVTDVRTATGGGALDAGAAVLPEEQAASARPAVRATVSRAGVRDTAATVAAPGRLGWELSGTTTEGAAVQPGGGMPDMQQLLQQAQQMQQQLMSAQQELAEAEVSGSAGGGLVTAVMSGSGELQSVTIDPKVVDPEDVETLGDLIVAAVRDANGKVAQLAQQKMGPLAGGLGGDLGGLGGLGQLGL